MQANCDRSPKKAEISIPGVSHSTAETVFDKGKRAVQIKDGELTLEFEPIQSHVYRIRPDQIVAREDQGP